MKIPKTKHVLFAAAVTIMIQFQEKTTFLKLISKFRNNKNRIVKTYHRINPIRKFYSTQKSSCYRNIIKLDNN